MFITTGKFFYFSSHCNIKYSQGLIDNVNESTYLRVQVTVQFSSIGILIFHIYVSAKMYLKNVMAMRLIKYLEGNFATLKNICGGVFLLQSSYFLIRYFISIVHIIHKVKICTGDLSCLCKFIEVFNLFKLKLVTFEYMHLHVN